MKKIVFSVASRATGGLQIKPSGSGNEDGLYPSHGPLRFLTSRSPLPCEKRSAWGGGCQDWESVEGGLMFSMPTEIVGGDNEWRKRECKKRNSDLSLLSFNLLVVIDKLMPATQFSRRCFAVLVLLYFVPSAFYADVWRILEGTCKAYIFFPTHYRDLVCIMAIFWRTLTISFSFSEKRIGQKAFIAAKNKKTTTTTKKQNKTKKKKNGPRTVKATLRSI